MKQSFEEAEIGEEFVQDGYIYLKLDEFISAVVLDDYCNPVEAPIVN